MTNQINRDLNPQATDQATDLAYQPEQLSNEELESVAGGNSGWGWGVAMEDEMPGLWNGMGAATFSAKWNK